MLVHQLSSYLVSRARELAPTKPLDVVKKMEAIVDLMATNRQFDDAAVDHIEQYWRGGKTILENARLAHRYCNGARPRHD
jgi:HNH endonuclease